MNIGPAVRGMRLRLSSPVIKTNTASVMAITFVSVSDSACICVDQDDGKKVVYPSTNLSLACPHCTGALQLFERPHNGRLDCSLLYRAPGIYNITVSAGRPQDQPITDSVTVTVESDVTYCPPPRVVFTDPQLAQPLNPVQLLTTDRYTITFRVLSTPSGCVFQPDYLWQIWLQDPITATDSRLVVDDETGTVPSYFIQPKTLTPGSYRVALIYRSVDRLGVTKKVQIAEGFIKVTPAPLKIKLLDTTMASVTVSEDMFELCLWPEKYSINPNGNVS